LESRSSPEFLVLGREFIHETKVTPLKAHDASADAIADRMSRVVRARGISMAQLALAWVLHQVTHVMAIPGMKLTAHLADNLAAAKAHLSEDDLAQLVS
jgi:aryl-alcohol dehydrogenase-like predicted oxidoreductase